MANCCLACRGATKLSWAYLPWRGDTFMLALLFGQAYLIFQLSWEQGQFECCPCLLSLILPSHHRSLFPWICPWFSDALRSLLQFKSHFLHASTQMQTHTHTHLCKPCFFVSIPYLALCVCTLCSVCVCMFVSVCERQREREYMTTDKSHVIICYVYILNMQNVTISHETSLKSHFWYFEMYVVYCYIFVKTAALLIILVFK